MAVSKQKTIRVGIDGGDFDPEKKVKSGISRLVKSFMDCIPMQKTASIAWSYYCFTTQKSNSRNITYRKINLPGPFFSSLFLPLKMYADKIGIYLGFSGVLPGLVRLFKIKSIIFIHDLGFYGSPKNYRDPARMQWQTEYSLFGAERIVVFSDYIKSQIFNRFPQLNKSKVIRIYPGADHIKASRAASPMEEEYFLYVGVIKQAKNIETLLHRFFKFLTQTKKKNTKLVLVGPKEDKYYQRITKSALYENLKGNLIFLENIEDKLLADYYCSSLAVLNVSHEEGFCYPVAEALQLGRPAIVNNLPLYHEFARHYKTLHIKKTETEYINAMVQIAHNKAPAANVKQSVFKWSKFTNEILQVIKSIYP